jgi:hypothetical protein
MIDSYEALEMITHAYGTLGLVSSAYRAPAGHEAVNQGLDSVMDDLDLIMAALEQMTAKPGRRKPGSTGSPPLPDTRTRQ